MVDEAVDHRGGDDVVGEDLAPSAEGHVAGDEDRALLVAGRDELEEQVRGVRVEREVADLVDDQQPVAAEAFQFVLKATALVRGLQPGGPAGSGVERRRVAGVAGLDPESDA